MRSRSNPELSVSIHIEENTFCGRYKPGAMGDDKKVMFGGVLKRSSSVDNVCKNMNPWNDENIYLEFKAEHDAIKGARASAVIMGEGAAAEILNSPATPGPRSSVKRILQFSPSTPMSPARRFTFSTPGETSPKLREPTRVAGSFISQATGSNTLLLLDSTKKNRTMSLGSGDNNTRTPRRAMKPGLSLKKKSRKGKVKKDELEEGQKKLTDVGFKKGEVQTVNVDRQDLVMKK